MINKRSRAHKPEAILPGSVAPPVKHVKRSRSLTWLAGLTAALILFLLLLPGDIRIRFWHSLQSQAVLVSMLLVFSLLAISLVWSAGQRLDTWIFLSFNVRGRRPRWLDQTMLAITQAGNGLTALAVGLLLLAASHRYLAYEFLLGALSLWLVVELIKFIVHRSRPFIHLAQARIVGYRASGRSFPSGHTSQVFFMATLMAQYFHPGLGLVAVLYSAALLVGLTRLYVGAHYQRDVLAGAILGSAWGLLGMLVNGRILN